MSTKSKDGGPAFPLPDVFRPDGVHAAGGHYGMSLRDWFAGQALAGLLAGQFRDGSRENFTTLPAEAYAISDAMLAAREAKS